MAGQLAFARSQGRTLYPDANGSLRFTYGKVTGKQRDGLIWTPFTTAEGLEVVPLKLVKAVLPDPSSLAPDYTGKTCIGDLVKGTRNGEEVEVFVYNIADHKDAYTEVGSQGISYTAGVPPVAMAMLIADGTYDLGRMMNVEELDPKPLFTLLDTMGLPTRVQDAAGDRAWDQT